MTPVVFFCNLCRISSVVANNMCVIIAGLCLLATCAYGAPAPNVTSSTTNAVTPNTPVPSQQIKEIKDNIVIARKREIPDALVDHPEDFEESSEENNQDGTFQMSENEDDSSSIERSRLDDAVNEYPYYSDEGRRKRTTDVLSGRSRGFDPEEAKLLISLLSRGHYFNFPRRTADDWPTDNQPAIEINDNELIDGPPEYLVPVREDAWPEAVNQNYPYRRVALPAYNPYVL